MMTKVTKKEYLKFCREVAYNAHKTYLSVMPNAEPYEAIHHACLEMHVELKQNPDTYSLAQKLFGQILFLNTEQEMRDFIDALN